jgi:hypothetical protein
MAVAQSWKVIEGGPVLSPIVANPCALQRYLVGTPVAWLDIYLVISFDMPVLQNRLLGQVNGRGRGLVLFCVYVCLLYYLSPNLQAHFKMIKRPSMRSCKSTMVEQ